MPENEKKQCMVIFQPSGRRGNVDEGINLKQASRLLGVDIEGICGDAGTCGKCKVRIEDGFFQKYGVESKRSNLSPLTESEKDVINTHMESEGYRLACQAKVLGDVVVFVPEESRMGKQIVRKAATERKFDIKPAVRKYYVKLTPASLHDALGDWERLQSELNKQFGLTNLSIDYPTLLSLQENVRKGEWAVTISIWMGKEVIRVEPGLVEKGYGFAVDIGTTTVAGYLCELATGTIAATESMMNPQVIYGEDVMSRITYCMVHEDGLQRLNEAIIKGLNDLAGRAAAQAHLKRSDITDMVLVGNTCMHHLVLNLPPQYIGRSPFAPAVHHSVNVKARDMGIKLSPGAYVHVLPILAGFVGADTAGVLIAEAPYEHDEMQLVIDIGTNGELVLGNSKRLATCSCATGPALEGAEIKFGMRAAPGAIEKIKIDKETKEARFKIIGMDEWNTELAEVGAKGICGSAIIDVVPELYIAGIIDHTGRFRKDVNTQRLRNTDDGPEFVIAWAKETSIGQDIVICQKDVRNIQLAKAALYAGGKIMMRRLGVEKLDKVVLAGAFGSHIDKESAACLAIFPDCDMSKVYSVGNAAGDGARIALLNIDKREEADRVSRQVEHVELTLEADFEKMFGQAMWLPHMKDDFPHIKHLLPEKPKMKIAKGYA
ncbi:MAG: ASKHA domain-containing protein [Dehalococcoidia bacterium]|nr:ASKHA domain-containing protein [Dehalococcoidia bacterium]